jgi:hypothetical protein
VISAGSSGSRKILQSEVGDLKCKITNHGLILINWFRVVACTGRLTAACIAVGARDKRHDGIFLNGESCVGIKVN